MNVLFEIFIAVAVWRVSSILVFEGGPFDLVAKFRDKAGVKYGPYSLKEAHNPISKLFVCIWCMSFWVGMIAAYLFSGFNEWYIAGLAYSTISILVEKFTQLGSYNAR